uniref:Fibronectin n=1 Tax=Phallusia mammillata TaxID=59560 RepID=A0A6F9DCB4_9ASCI|nr:fibronectin [Phallusia mammillata]
MDTARIFSCIVFLLMLSVLSMGKLKKREKRQSEEVTCLFLGETHLVNERWRYGNGTKYFQCVCTSSGIPRCDWFTTSVVRRRCYDRAFRRYRTTDDRWERLVRGKTLDCVCEQRAGSRRMQISCSGENRCHSGGQSYRTGDDWQTSDITGLVMDCQCLGSERVSCRASVTTDVPRPEVNAQWVEDHIVYGQRVLRPKLATLQACDTGSRVVSSGYTWNRTSEVLTSTFVVERCICQDALISCSPYTVSRRPEPHCVTEDGQVRLVGEVWTKTHHSHENLSWRCSCRAHGDKECRDIGYCEDPHPPPNGGLVCVVAGKSSPKQSTYCKPMCAQGFDFVNTQRIYRIWEVCNHVTTHRWSGGYAEDSLLIGKCQRTSRERGRRSLYLPTADCLRLSRYQIQEIKQEFIQLLHANGLCGNKCQAKFFRCGDRTSE